MLDLSSLDANGYLLIPGLLEEHWIHRLKQEEQRFAAQTSNSLSVQVQLVHRSSTIREFAMNGPHIPTVLEVLGPNVCFTHQQYVAKRPDEKFVTDVPWHQDSGYGHLEPANDLTVWMTLDDCDEENGCLWVIPGSHKLGLQKHDSSAGFMTAEVSQSGIPIPMQAGDALIFGGLLMHRSLPNKTGEPRVAIYLRYCGPEVIMVSKGNKSVLEDEFSWMVAGEAP